MQTDLCVKLVLSFRLEHENNIGGSELEVSDLLTLRSEKPSSAIRMTEDTIATPTGSVTTIPIFVSRTTSPRP